MSGTRRECLALVLALASIGGCTRGAVDDGADKAGGNTAPPNLKSTITASALLADITMLASDSFQGRKPGSPGEDLTVAYLEREFKAAGLAPGNTDGTYIQKVKLVGLTPDTTMVLTVKKGSQTRDLAFKKNMVAFTKRITERAALNNSEMVFVGYGVEAPEYGWDDFKGVDVAGKTMIVLVNDPPLADSTKFGGRAMTYYGRWTYKLEQAARHKAAGVFIVHETVPAGYPWTVIQGMGGEHFELSSPDKNAGRAAVEGWVTVDDAKALFAMAGQDFDSLKARALSPDFKPVSLGVKASITVKNTLRTVDSRNVIGILPGSDSVLKNEYVIYTAHWDHFGIGDKVNGDSIYNGAVDNASGTGGLINLARAFAKGERPARSIIFLAVTAEEQGLLGSQHYAENPIYPLSKTLAEINIDVLNVRGRTKDIVEVGYGASELDDYLKTVGDAQGRVVKPDAQPEKGFYYRSDHFNFAKRGVPALYLEGGMDFLGQPADYGKKAREQFVKEAYHSPEDEVRAEWNLEGAVEDLDALYSVGLAVANAKKYPEWRPGNEFKAIRDKQLSEPKK